MGAAWCKNRAEKAHDSKSPLDRVIVKCVNQMSLTERPIPAPVVIQGPAKYPRLHLNSTTAGVDPPRPNTASEWQEVVLRVPEKSPRAAPVPPPRKKRMAAQNMANQERQEEQDNKEKRKEQESKSKKQEQDVKNMVDEKAKENQGQQENRKPSTPAIYLEVDTPSAKHRKSSPLLIPDPTKERKRGSESDLLGLPPRSKSSMSLRSSSPVSEATTERLQQYMKSCRSFGSLKPEDLLDEISQAFSDTSSEDSWPGFDDGDHYHAVGGSPPLTPTSQITTKSSPTRSPKPEFTIGEPDKPEKKKRKKSKKSRDAKKSASDEGKPNIYKNETKSTVSRNDKQEDLNEDVLAPPANFQTDPKSHLQNDKSRSQLIKPSQISVQDFLRQSSDSSEPKSQEIVRSVHILPELTLEVPSDSSTFSFDFSKGLIPPRSPQIEIPGTPRSPQGLSRCSSPLPPIFTNGPSPTQEETLSSWTAAEDETAANLMQIMQEYHNTADVIGDKDAKKILEELGIPENLLDELPNVHKPHKHNSVKHKEEQHVIKVNGVTEEGVNKLGAPEENGSSGMSSMTPSLTELEASLSELLEASAVSNDDEEFEELQNQSLQVAPTSLMESSKDTIKKPTLQQKENILEVVISQEVPKIITSQGEEISHEENPLNKTKGDTDIVKTSIPTTKEESRTTANTLVQAV